MKVKCQVSSVKCQNGQILIIAIIFITVILILTTSLFSRVAGFVRFGSNSILKEQAISLAEAAIDNAVWQLNKTAGAYNGENDTALGSVGTFSVQIIPKTSSLKTIVATGFVPNSTTPRAKRTIKADVLISSEAISFRYAVQVGTGGVVMNNSATINGSVYSNAPDDALRSIQGYNSSVITGDAWTVGTISIPDPWVQGNKHENQPSSQMPTIDYQQWKDTAADGGTIDCGITPALCNLSGSGSANIGPKKYQGNLTISNSKIVTMQGPVYVTGNFSISNSARLNLDNSFGSNGTVLIVDGTITISNGGLFNPTSANPKGYILATTTSTNNSAMSISNQGATAVFYALEGGAQLTNTAEVSALVAKKLTMSNSSQLNYDSGLASAQFSSGPGGSWQIKKGTYRFTTSP